MPTSSSRGRRNPSGRNQHSDWGVVEMAREHPAAAAAGAAAAGLFLWSRRTQISEQLGHLSDQFGEWRESMRSDTELEIPEPSGRRTRNRRGRVQPASIQ